MMLALFSLCFLLQDPSGSAPKTSRPEQKQVGTGQRYTPHDERGTENSPIVVKVLPSLKTAEETAQEAAERQEKTSSDWWLDFFTGVLATMAIIQAFVFGYQGVQLKRTVAAAEGQSADMKQSIAEAARAANAMEQVAVHIEASAKAATVSVGAIQQQMRAYITVIVWGGIYQDRTKGIRFAGQPSITNMGNTPARKVKHKAAAAILPVPLPVDFDFPLPEQWSGGNVIGAHQNTLLTVPINEFVDDASVEEIKSGGGKAVLYVWGMVTYVDVFEDEQSTKFCQILTWLPDGRIWGYFLDRHNDAT